MNNTQKFDDIRRRLTRMETELTVVRRMTLLVCEYIRGPSDLYILPRELAILSGSQREGAAPDGDAPLDGH